jgi:hypothetical protein
MRANGPCIPVRGAGHTPAGCDNSITRLTWEITGTLATPQWALPRLGECVLRLVQRMGFTAELEDATRPRTRRCRTAGQGARPSFDNPTRFFAFRLLVSRQLSTFALAQAAQTRCLMPWSSAKARHSSRTRPRTQIPSVGARNSLSDLPPVQQTGRGGLVSGRLGARAARSSRRWFAWPAGRWRRWRSGDRCGWPAGRRRRRAPTRWG